MSGQEWTPTTADITEAWVGDGRSPHAEEREEAFDRWRAALDREVAARAWDEGHEDGEYDERNRASIEHGTRSPTSNPYRAEAGA